MDTHRDIIKLWPSVAEFARAIGVPYINAQKMSSRNSISPTHWVTVIEAAGAAGIGGVTLERLAAAKQSQPVAAE